MPARTRFGIKVTPLFPKEWKLAPVVEEIRLALAQAANESLNKLHDVTATWNHQPEFSVYRRAVGSTIGVYISTTDPAFRYLNDGTEAHSISPKSPVSKRNPNRPSALSTRESYAAKTSPGVLSSWSGGHEGRVIYKPGVWHPGIIARDFTGTLQKQMQPTFQQAVYTAVDRGLARGIKP